MHGEAWSGISLSGVAADGDLKQLYPTWMSAGVQKGGGSDTPGALIRKPYHGVLHSIQVKTDSSNGGTIEIWDVDASKGGVDVSSADTITDAQLDALVTRGLAKLIYEQDFVASDGAATPSAPGRKFAWGLAARFVAGSGSCELNLVVSGGAKKNESAGA